MNPKDIAAVLEQHRYDQHPDTPEDLLHKAAISDALAELPGANKEQYTIIAAAYRAEAAYRAQDAPCAHEWGRKISEPGTPVCVDCGALYADLEGAR